ncbi:hypothetical protein SO802_021853 [Lithocarpus litseifolius]|uniref:Uncharacterized protein n=1 Tax=Lithocarpus litseifolius TaxID=425828 RepID=A0AAW2CG93_9ROSI
MPKLKKKRKVVDVDAEEGEVSPRQQKGPKQQKGGRDNMRVSPPRHRSDPYPREAQQSPAWASRLDPDGAPIPTTTSIWEFQNGHSSYIAEALERPLLLPRDMETVRSWRQADLFMSMKRDLAMLTQQVYVAEDWVRDARNLAKVETQSRKEVEKSLGELKHQKLELAKKLTIEERERRSAEAGLKSAQDQAEDQQKSHFG